MPAQSFGKGGMRTQLAISLMHCFALQYSVGHELSVSFCCIAGDTQALAPATEEQAREAAATDTGAAGEDTDEAMPDAGAASEEEDMWAQPDKPDEQPHEVGTRLNARQTGHSRSLPTAFASTAYWQQMQKRSHSQGMA